VYDVELTQVDAQKSYDSEQEIDEHGLYLFKTTEIFYLSIVTVAS